MRLSKKLISIALLATIISTGAIFTGCSSQEDTAESTTAPTTTTTSSSTAPQTADELTDIEPGSLGEDAGYQLEEPESGDEIAIMHTNMGDIYIRFFPEAAPKAVENFVTHSKDGYYDGLTFHRVMNDFMIQGGDPTATGTGGESIWGEDFEDEFDENLLNLRGSLAMANAGPGTNGSQFFINQATAENINWAGLEDNWNSLAEVYNQTEDKDAFLAGTSYINFYDPFLAAENVQTLYEENGGNPTLDGSYNAIERGHTVFGQVYKGMDVVDKIAAVETDSSSKPVEDVVIESIEITTFE